MPSPRFCTQWLLLLWVVLLLLLPSTLGACGQSLPVSEEETLAQLLVQNEGTALALTDWPSPPPIITRPPTPTAEPRPLWTASPQPQPAPTDTQAPLTPNTQETDLPPTIPQRTGAPPVQLFIPSLDLNVPVTQVSWEPIQTNGTWQSVWQTADGSAGHHRNSANPGQVGNMVISGHHNTRGQVFRQVSEIGQPQSGFDIGDDIIVVTVDDQRFTYSVVDWIRFQEEGITDQEQREHASYLAGTAEATLTLITCWPYESNTHRVIVIAKLQP